MIAARHRWIASEINQERETADIIFIPLSMDVTQRGGDFEGAVVWCRREGIPFSVYTEPRKAHTNIVVSLLDENPVALQILAAGLRRIVNALRRNLKGEI